MNIPLFLIQLALITLVGLSCAETKTIETKLADPLLIQPSVSDTLNFTSGIRSILQDRNGNYWIGSHQEGACLYDGETFSYFTMKEGLADNQVRSIKEDSYGTIWFGTANGVSRYDGGKINTPLPMPSDDSEYDKEKAANFLWFNAGNNAGVYRTDGQLLNYFGFPNPESNSSYDSYGVTAISKSREGEVWIASYSALFHFDCKTIHDFDNINSALSGSDRLHIRSVLADSKGRIWIGNNGIGVLLFDGDSTINFSEKNGLIHANSLRSGGPSPEGTLEHVFAIEEDSQGNIWFGDRDTGAWRFDGRSMTNYTIDERLTSEMIWTICKDRNGNLLFAMADGGVYQFDGKGFEKKF